MGKGRAELIHLIEAKVLCAHPTIRDFFIRGLKRKTVAELERILGVVSVSEDGYDIRLTTELTEEGGEG